MAKFSALKAAILLIVSVFALANSATINGHPKNRILREYEDISGGAGTYFLKWEVDFDTNIITFYVRAQTTGFVGFGLSTTGGMMNADIVIGGVDAQGASYFKDRHGTGHVVPVQDESQDWDLISASDDGTWTELKFSRLVDTCDKSQDVAIKDDTVKVIWSIGRSDDLNQGHANRGVHSAMLLDPPMPPVDTSKYDKWTLDRTMVMPSAHTSYWCTIHRSPADYTQKRHVVGFSTVLHDSNSLAYTHHLNVYKCTAPPGQTDREAFDRFVGTAGGECYGPTPIVPTDYCRQMLYVWAVGGKPMFFPEDVGYPIIETGEAEYLMLEIHYNNPEEVSGVSFTSSVEIHNSVEERPQEAGVLITAHSISFSHLIPPNAKEFVTISHCGPECTGRKIEPAGIHFTNVMLHSHLLGREMKLRHFRDGKELPWISVDDNYEFDYQQNRPLREETHVLPKDQLTMECTTDSTAETVTGITIGGLSTTAEMCQGIIWYYPRGELRFCESAYEEAKILEKYGITNIQWDNILAPPIILEPESMRGDFVEVINRLGPWTAKEIDDFQQEVRFTEHYEVSCGILPFPEEERRKKVYSESPKAILIGYPETDGDYAPVDTCEVTTTTTTPAVTTTTTPAVTTTTTPAVTTTQPATTTSSSTIALPFAAIISILSFLTIPFV